MFRSVEQRYNIKWRTGPRRVSYQYRSFTEFVAEGSCGTCSLNSTARTSAWPCGASHFASPQFTYRYLGPIYTGHF